MSYTVNNGTPVVETITNVVNSGDTIVYSFNTSLDMSTDGIYNIDYECLLSNEIKTLQITFIRGLNENFVSPTAPVTVDDTICTGDTAYLEAVSSQVKLIGNSDINGTQGLKFTAVTPFTTTTYYAEVQASRFYKDDFESYYPNGFLIAQSSPNWSTISGTGGGQDDVESIFGAQASSGNNSIYINHLNDDDLYMLIDSIVNSGNVEISFDIRVETNANINFQESLVPVSNEIFQVSIGSGTLAFDIGPTVLTAPCPANSNWFNLKIIGDLDASTWNIYLDDNFVFGSYIAGGNLLGSVNFRPEPGDEYYIDDVEWYVISDDDCISPLAPITIVVEDCSGIGETINHNLELYPNPTNGFLNFNGNTLLEDIQAIDNHGKIVFEIKINSFKGSLDLSHLNRGIYFVKASSNF